MVIFRVWYCFVVFMKNYQRAMYHFAQISMKLLALASFDVIILAFALKKYSPTPSKYKTNGYLIGKI